MMKRYLALLLFLLLAVAPAVAAQNGEGAGVEKKCRNHDLNMDCDGGPDWCKNERGMCSPEMRGRCGKRRGDWYGASQPVTTAAEAREQLQSYFTGQGFTVSEVTEKRWGFRANIIDKDGKTVDQVMIDKRSGRIRSLY